MLNRLESDLIIHRLKLGNQVFNPYNHIISEQVSSIITFLLLCFIFSPCLGLAHFHFTNAH